MAQVAPLICQIVTVMLSPALTVITIGTTPAFPGATSHHAPNSRVQLAWSAILTGYVNIGNASRDIDISNYKLWVTRLSGDISQLNSALAAQSISDGT